MLRCIFGSDRRRLTLHNQLLENLSRSLGPIVYQVVVDEVPVGNSCLKLRLFS